MFIKLHFFLFLVENELSDLHTLCIKVISKQNTQKNWTNIDSEVSTSYRSTKPKKSLDLR